MAKVEVESEVTGNVWKVEVSPGAAVSEGQVLIILESMKMEMKIRVQAPAGSKCGWRLATRTRRCSREVRLRVGPPVHGLRHAQAPAW